MSNFKDKEIINGAVAITTDCFYFVDDNVVKAFSPSSLVTALNEMFGVEIDPLHSKISASNRNVVRVGESTEWQEAGFGYKGLFNYLKTILNIPIDTDKSFARTTTCWYVYLQDSYKEAFNKMLDSEGKEEDNQPAKTETQATQSNNNTQEIINNNKEVNTNEEDAGQEKTENSTGNEPDGSEAGVQQDQEGTQDESGAPDVPADPSGNGVQGLNDHQLNERSSEPVAKEEPKPKQTRQRKAKK